ncbi:MAG: serine/threonine protein kinase [Deltaproteobacteria bacterium]|nr:serine/threonine protein kinase [Deltaproteobacteria bacterium]
MATLFLARRSGAAGFSRHVAVKVVHPHLAEDPSFIRMFVDEALLSARIHHPNVVHVEELGEEKGTYFLVMEYVHGSALSTMLGTLARQDRRLAPELAVHVAMKVADGLDAAHELLDDKGQRLGVVHRDVSPQNVLLSAAGHVKLIDFGIAKAAGQGRRTETGSLKGKVRYMSPEQAFGRNIDRRTDIYALAIVLWEMLTMQRMFKGTNDLALLDEVRNPKIVPPSTFSPEIPAALDQVLLAALSRDSEQRPRTARDFRRMLQEAYPEASAVGEERLGEVVRAVLGEHIEMRRITLPESVTGLNVRNLEKKSDLARSEILRTMTVSAPGARYAVDHEVSEPRLPAAVMQAVSPGATPTEARPSAARWLAIGGAVVAFSSVTTAGIVYVVSQPASEPTVTQLAPLAPPVAGTPPTTATSIPTTPTTVLVEDAGVTVASTPDDPREGERHGTHGHRRDPRDQGTSMTSMVVTTVRDDGPPPDEDDGVMRIRTGGVTIYDDEF